MVKPLHPIDEIAARILEADGSGVRLTHAVSGEVVMPSNGRAVAVDPVEATLQALAEPLNYPPLAAGIVPGDRVAIAVDDRVPSVASIVRGAVQSLQLAGVDPQDIAIVTTDAKASHLCRDELVASVPGLQFVIHDPAEEKNLCLVGATKHGQPLLVNRTIFEADLVLPIGCAEVGRENAYDSLYPRFSNAETIERYRTPVPRDASPQRKGKRSEVDEAGWMIGVAMTVYVVPGPDETVAHVLAGEPQAAARRSDELCREQWLLHSPQRASLVIATITGDDAAQTWANVGRALATAEGALEEGGAVAICSNLSESPGESLGRLLGRPDVDKVARKISHDHSADSITAWHLVRALQRGPVFFLSQLSEDMVEDLGLAFVESVDEIVRLASHHDSFIVIDDAQHAVVTVDGGHDAE